MVAPHNFKNLNVAVSYLSQKFHLQGKNKNSLPELSKLRQIHSLLIVSGYDSDHSSFVNTFLLHCVSLPSFPRAYALSIFNQLPHRNVYTYNAVIRAFISDPKTAFFIYANMRREAVSPNKHTFPLLLKSKQIPFQIFAHSIKFGFGSDHFLRNTMLSVCANGGFIECARKVFDEMPQRDVVAYTALMDGYVRTGRAREAMELFLDMRVSGIMADEVAVVSALCAVGTLGYLWLGRWIHGFYVEPERVVRDAYVCTALVNMYLKCSCCEDAMRVFRCMPNRSSVSWNALLSGYVQCSKFKDVLLLFDEMLAEKVEPNDATLVTVLTACAHLGSLDRGMWLPKYIDTRKLELTSVLGTALIDMYAKCGCVEEAFLVFERMCVKDVYPWTALIYGVAMNGDAAGALNLFSQMLSSGVRPNDVTFVAVLSACSHGGLVTEGKRLFEAMEGVHGVQPSIDHYGCMVDMLGRAGLLREAAELIENMPVEPNAAIWGALSGACMIPKDFEMGRFAGKQLIELQPHHSGRYALLANLHSKCGDEEAAASVRRRMKEGGVHKPPGCSWIESSGEVNEFVASDKSHVAAEAVYCTLHKLTAQMKMEQLPFVIDDVQYYSHLREMQL